MPARMNLADHARAFLTYLDEWFGALQNVPLADIIAGEPERVAVYRSMSSMASARAVRWRASVLVGLRVRSPICSCMRTHWECATLC